MKKTFYEFLHYFHTNFIVEDFDDLNMFGKIVIYPAWLIRSVFMWVLLPVFIVPFLIQRSDFYKKIKENQEEIMTGFFEKQNI